jgi:tRNA-2-methylthio-N6-dimethylallyladenosine synthase
MNKADSETMAGLLKEVGHTPTLNLNQAELIIFNTCCVRKHAENRLYGNIEALKSLKKRRPALILAVGGCVAEKEEGRILERFPHVDLVFGTNNFHVLPQLIENYLANPVPVCNTNGDALFPENLPNLRQDRYRAWVPIIRGCDNFCTYCIVPHVRGQEHSRKIEDILQEVRNLVNDGVREITLLGQNVNSYGKDLSEKNQFAQLLKALDEIENLKRIRFITSHPKDLSLATIDAIANSSRICEHFHLPLQAGSDRILAAMNRRYNQNRYSKLVDVIRRAVPKASITTDLIVGFPGETEEDFNETLKMVETIRFDQAFTFLYSPRQGTVAARRRDDVPREVKQRRFNCLVALQNRISLEKNKDLVSETAEVFVERKSRRDPKILAGRTRTNKIVNFPGSQGLMNTFVDVRIIEAGTFSLKGRLCGETAGKQEDI